VLATFGPPRRVYHDGVYTVLVWTRNLLADLSRAAVPARGGAPAPTRSHHG